MYKFISGDLTLSYCATVTSWTSGYISGAENFHSFITQILPARKPLISTDSHSMAAYIFLRWVLIVIYSSQIRHFHEIMQLPTLRNSHFCSYSHSLPCVRKTHDAQILRCVCVLTLCSQDTVTKNSCVLHHASCTRMYTRTHGNRQHCEKTIKTGIF